MEIRAQAPSSPSSTYVDTTIPKVADTPMEGTSSFEEAKTYGPFVENNDSTLSKTPNKQAKFVRFLDQREDPIEKAFDSIFLFMDDVREAGSTPRSYCGTNNVEKATDIVESNDSPRQATEAEERDDYDVLDDSEVGIIGAMVQKGPSVECVQEGLCHNPCVEGFSNIPPPADMMLSVESERREEEEVSEETPAVKEKTAKRVEFCLSKENSVKDMTSLADEETEDDNFEEDEDEEESGDKMIAFMNKMRRLVPKFLPEECQYPADTILEKISNSIAVEVVEMKPEAVETLTVKKAADEDPIVEAIDNLIIFIDDIQSHLTLQHKDIGDLLHPYVAELQQNFEDLHQALIYQKEELFKQLEKLTGEDAESLKAQKKKNKKKPLSKQMDPKDYAEALESAANILSQNASEADLKDYTQEELHQRALERIMSEQEDFDDENSYEYKTEEMILAELMEGHDLAIMGSRSKEQKDQEQKKPEPTPKEELIVLGHSATLTPIPEADEASAGTPTTPTSEKNQGKSPTTEKFEEGVSKGTIPEVPSFTAETKKSAVPEAKAAAAPVAKDTPVPIFSRKTEKEMKAAVIAVAESAESDPEAEAEAKAIAEASQKESDPIVMFIDTLFLLYDDVSAGMKKATDKPCNACFVTSVPSDLADPANDKVHGDLEDPDDDIREAPQAAIEPRPETIAESMSSEGQNMIQEALKMIQEASKMVQDVEDDMMSPDEARIAKSSERITSANGEPVSDDIMDLVNAAFQQNEMLRKALESDAAPTSSDEMTPQMSMDTEQQTKLEFEIPESLKHPSQDQCIGWGGDDSEIMASINADRKLSEMEHENIFRDVSKGETTVGISIYNAPAFTEGNSGSAEQVEERIESLSRASSALKALCAESARESGISAQQPQRVVAPTE